MFCDNCGKPIPDNARFCGNCGKALAQPAQTFSAPAPQQTVAAPVYPVTPPSYTPPTPQPAPQVQPTYPTADPVTSAPVPQPVSQNQLADLVPPNMPWYVVLILSWVTFGLCALIWGFKQAFFVKKIDSSSNAVLMLTLAVICGAIQVVLNLFGVRSYGSEKDILMGICYCLNIPIIILGLISVYGMRSSLIRHYNSVEPIGLKLGGFMTFFFSILYFQYHFSRIVKWKKTGVL